MVNDALRSLGIPIGNVNSERFEDESFFSSVPMTIKGSYERLGTFRDYIIQNSINLNMKFKLLIFLPYSKFSNVEGRGWIEY